MLRGRYEKHVKWIGKPTAIRLRIFGVRTRSLAGSTDIRRLRQPRAMPLVVRRDAVDAPDRLRIGAHRERRGRTHDRQGFPIDIGNCIPGTLEVRVERDTRLAAPKSR